jgi:hypothetical protein
VPPAGYQVPAGPQAPVTKRIPEDLPFIVRPSVGRRLLLFGPLALIIIVPLLLVLSLALTAGGADQSTSGDAVALVVLSFCLIVPIVGLLALQIFLITSGGPVLAVGPAGLWIKTRPTRGQAIWLPWEGIERISRRRWSFEKMVVVKPRDPRASTGLGAFTAVDSSMLKLFYGSGFTATLNFGDRREPEIMAAIQHFSAGRTFIAN